MMKSLIVDRIEVLAVMAATALATATMDAAVVEIDRTAKAALTSQIITCMTIGELEMSHETMAMIVIVSAINATDALKHSYFDAIHNRVVEASTVTLKISNIRTMHVFDTIRTGVEVRRTTTTITFIHTIEKHTGTEKVATRTMFSCRHDCSASSSKMNKNWLN